MTINLNAFPIKIPDDDLIEYCEIPFDDEKLKALRKEYQTTHTFYRKGDQIQIFSSNGDYPEQGEISNYELKDNYRLLCYLFKDGLVRYLHVLERNPRGFNPIELVSSRPDDNLLANIFDNEFPFGIFAKYKLGTRIINGVPNLTIDCSTKTICMKKCSYFISKGFHLFGRCIAQEDESGYRKIIGSIENVEGDKIEYLSKDGEIHETSSENVYLEASRVNFDEYVAFLDSKMANNSLERVRLAVSSFNAGASKRERIEKLHGFIKSKTVYIVNGIQIEIGDSLDIRKGCHQFEKPVFIFNDNGEANWAEKGFSQYGPYTKRTFDRNDPSVCVICLEEYKGQVEQFVRKFLKGISGHKYFSKGLEGKFSVGTSRTEVFTTQDESVSAYSEVIKSAIQKKAQDGGKWDLAIVQVRESFKALRVEDNPYYVGKSIFFLHQIPVQDFTLELMTQSNTSLGYSLNNMALASYGKMGGVPWLLKSSPTLSHELVIGIGSANLQEDRFSELNRIMGITTVFSGDGSYIISNTSKAVLPEKYCDALTTVLRDTLAKIQKRMNWQHGDTIRIVFHASVKTFNKDEVQAVKSVMDNYKDYNVEFAFLKISEQHDIQMFDSSTANDPKGKYAPLRGKYFKLSNFEMLIYLVGRDQLKQVSDGHPQGLILSTHRDSTFKDIKYLSTQLYNFSSHSWRSYFPGPMPVTIIYSNLIAKNLGWLNQVPGWNDSIMIGKIGQTQWFL